MRGGWSSTRDLLGGSVARNFAWAATCASERWKFACHIMNLPHERWARRMLHWQPSGRGPLGRPAMNWTTKFEQFCRLKHWRADAHRCMMEGGARIHKILYTLGEFVSQVVYNFILFVLVRGLPFRHANLRLRLQCRISPTSKIRISAVRIKF